jgi:asparagine synthase (glutamine-hydrolysing)
MRLICGILRLDGAPAAESTLKRMAAAMTAPGLSPALMLRVEGLLGLAVLDFSGEVEGLAERDDWLIAADLRLDRADIPDKALLEAARRYGPDFPDHLNGDFAVALWQREKKQLFLGRDFIGVRPLAWTWQSGRWFAFASLPKGLHGSGLAGDTVDPVAIAAKISNTYFTGSDSGFAEISYLQAGHSLRVSPYDTIAPRPHRAYRPSPSQVGSWRGSNDDAAGVLQRLVEEAVAARMPSTGPVACHLTGGLDSSAITVLAAREARRHSGGVLALTMMAAEPLGPAELDERPLIAAVLAQEPDIAHRTVADVLPMPGRDADPDWPGSVIGGPDDEMMAAALAFGADRLLSGVGGDEGASYNGANLYVALLRAGRLPSLMQELALRAKTDDVSLLRTIRNRVIVPLVPAILRRRRHAGVMDKKRGAVRYLGASIRDRVAARRMPPVLHSNRAADRVRAFADHHIPSRCTFYAIMAARHGLAVSFPLLDRRIVDFVLSLPVHQFLADGQSRQPFRRAMRGVLPDPVRLSRHKVGLFDDRFVRYASKRENLLTMLETLRANASPLLREMFDFDAIRAGLELLPQPHEADRVVRSAPGELINGNPAWVAVFGVGCLIAAWEISRK